jgi:hypothetical protein
VGWGCWGCGFEVFVCLFRAGGASTGEAGLRCCELWFGGFVWFRWVLGLGLWGVGVYIVESLSRTGPWRQQWPPLPSPPHACLPACLPVSWFRRLFGNGRGVVKLAHVSVELLIPVYTYTHNRLARGKEGVGRSIRSIWRRAGGSGVPINRSQISIDRPSQPSKTHKRKPWSIGFAGPCACVYTFIQGWVHM